MVDASDPNIVVGELAAGGLILGLFWRFFTWVRHSPRTPDPWDAEIERKLHEPDAVEICHRCLTPLSSEGWFCEHCGSAVGPYNNLMPFVHIFSEGEVLRNGVGAKLRTSPLIITGYLLYSLSSYIVFAPIYWFFFFKNLMRQKQEEELKEPDSTPSNSHL